MPNSISGLTVAAVEVLGGHGTISDYRMERMTRDAKLTQIYN